MVAMVYIDKSISSILFAKVIMHNFSYSHMMVKRLPPINANVNMYKYLHVPNSIKPEKRHNDKF